MQIDFWHQLALQYTIMKITPTHSLKLGDKYTMIDNLVLVKVSGTKT